MLEVLKGSRRSEIRTTREGKRDAAGGAHNPMPHVVQGCLQRLNNSAARASGLSELEVNVRHVNASTGGRIDDAPTSLSVRSLVYPETRRTRSTHRLLDGRTEFEESLTLALTRPPGSRIDLVLNQRKPQIPPKFQIRKHI